MLLIFMFMGLIGCSNPRGTTQISSLTTHTEDTMPSITALPSSTNTIVPTQTKTSTPTITPTSTPTATPLIKQGNEVISRENVNRLTQLGQIGKGSINDIAWSADGEKLVLGTGIGIYILSSETLDQEKFIQTTNQIISVDISPDNLTIISGNYSGDVELWDVSSGQKINHLHQWLYPSPVCAIVAFSPDGLKIASIGSEENLKSYMVLWDASTGEESQKFFIGDWVDFGFFFGGVEYFTFSTDGQLVAMGGTIHFGNRLTGEIETTEKKIFIWNVNEEKLLQTLIDSTNEDNYIISAWFNPDNSKLWVAYSNNTIANWDLMEEQLINKRELKVDGIAFAFSSDGKTMAVSDNLSELGFFEVGNERKINSLNYYFKGGNSSLNLLDNEKLAAAIGSNLYILDIESGKIQSNYSIHQFISAISSDGEILAFIEPHNDIEIISLINMGSGNEIYRLEGHTKRITSLEFSPDHKLLASGGRDNKVFIWDVETGTLLDTFNIYDSIGDLVFSSDGEKLAISTQKAVQVWDIVSGVLISTLTEYYKYGEFSSSVVFSPDGLVLASGNPLGPIHLFYTPTGVLLKYLEGHTGGINDLAFTPDGSILVSASDDYTIRFWNIESGEEIAIIDNLSGSVDSIIISEDGKMLISCGYDGIIRFWGISEN